MFEIGKSLKQDTTFMYHMVHGGLKNSNLKLILVQSVTKVEFRQIFHAY